jgi:hypothetical protein
MTHALIAIAFATACVVIGLRSAGRPAGQATAGVLIATLLVVAAEAAAGLSR